MADFEIIEKYKINGIVYDRILFGSEKYRNSNGMTECRDCGAKRNGYHESFICDFEECPRCHSSIFNCECEVELV